ncbi:ABC transporter B family member 5 [Strongyloides ratti]|uniref:ABC-type xenobiotic transporter n=1 Tax=Strongyloides ratti TaxID=34506 RepID=A0A090L5M9_STRRB|nr:ABC transporter B family member 5 [Strongyloides ratti]CEF63422.1 ABC transporter B family member 5 [Strongyloides ratti]
MSILLAMISGIIQPLENIILGNYFEAYLYGYKYFPELKNSSNVIVIEEMAHKDAYKHAILSFMVLITLFLSAICNSTLIERQVKIMKQLYFKSVLRQDMTWFEKNPPGEIASSLSTIFDKIRSGLNLKLTLFVSSTTYVITSIIISFYYQKNIGIAMLISTCFTILPLFFGVHLHNKFEKKEFLYSLSIGALVEEVLSSIKTVISFNGQLFEIKRYSIAVEKLLEASKKKLCFLTATCCSFYFLIYSQNAIYIYLSYELIKHKFFKFGSLICILFCSNGSAFRLQELTYQFLKFKEALSLIINVLKVVDTIPEIDSLNMKGETIDNVTGDISFENVSFSYISRLNELAIDNLSFKISAGESCAIVGKSGSGKSTIINLLMRFYQLKSGEILIDGKSHENLNINWLRGIISVVSQEPVLFTGTIKENILMGNLNATDDEIYQACKIAHAEEFINELPEKYDTYIGEGRLKMSGGQKQRIAIARALVRNPKILILDEATSALDASSEKNVQKALNEACKGRTTLAVSHKLSSIKNYDKIIVLAHGKIVECGNHEELMIKKGEYYKLYMCELKGIKNKKKKIAKESQDKNNSCELNENSMIVPAKKQKSFIDNIVSKCMLPLDPNKVFKKLTGIKTKGDKSISSKDSTSMDSIIQESLDTLIKDQSKPEKVIEKKTSLLEIIKFSKNEKKRFLIGIIFIFLKALYYPISVLIMGYTLKIFALSFDNEITKRKLIFAIIFVILSSFGNTLIYAICSYLVGLTGIRVGRNVRLAAYTNIMRQDMTFFDNKLNGLGALTKTLSSDALHFSQGIDLTCIDGLSGIFTIIISIFFTLNSNTILGLTAISLILSAALISYTLVIITHSILHKSDYYEKRSINIGLECVNNVKTIQCLSIINEMSEKFSDSLNKIYKYKVKSGILYASSFSLGYSSIIQANALAFGAGSKLITKGFATPYDIVMGSQYINYISFSFCLINPYIADYIPFRVAATKLFKIIKTIPKFDNLSNKGKTTPILGKIKMKSGYFSYPHIPNHLVLKDMTFKVNFGESLTFVGLSGSGKSTTMQVIERLYDLLDGILEIDDVNVKDYNIRHYRNAVSVVSQEPNLFDLSIKENICYGIENVSDEELHKAATIANVHDFIENLPKKYDTPVGIKGRNFSGGEKQRIAIARALVRKPNILLLDEATSALDNVNSIDVEEALKKAKVGRTCITICHKLNSAINSTFIAYVENGKILEFGNHEKLMEKQGLYYMLVQQQQLD